MCVTVAVDRSEVAKDLLVQPGGNTGTDRSCLGGDGASGSIEAKKIKAAHIQVAPPPLSTFILTFDPWPLISAGKHMAGG